MKKFLFIIILILFGCVDKKESYTKYDLVFNNGSESVVISIKDGSEFDFDKYKPDKKAGFKYHGWLDENNNIVSGKQVITKGGTYTAKWEEKSYTVTFDANGGTIGTGAIYTVEIGHDDKIDIAMYTLNRRVGFKFSGWENSNGELVTDNGTVTSDLYFKARWQALSYTVLLDANSGTINGNASQELILEHDTLVNMNLFVPVKLGSIFLGWFQGENKMQDTFYIEDNLTLAAKWEVDPMCRIYTETDLIKLSQDGIVCYLMDNITITTVWHPIESFNGILYGDDKTIKYKMSDGHKYNGLFSELSGAKIYDLNIELVDSEINCTTDCYVGTLAGRAVNSIIKNTKISGKITANAASSVKGYVGGLIGILEDDVGTSDDIESCSVDMILDISNDVPKFSSGGLVAEADNTTINTSYFQGSISGYNAGGLVAKGNELSINNSYVKAVITGYYAGGLVSRNDFFTSSIIIKNSFSNSNLTIMHGYGGGLISYGQVEITNSYATGEIYGTGYSPRFGGLSGYDCNAWCTNTINSSLSLIDKIKTNSTFYSINRIAIGGITGSRNYALQTMTILANNIPVVRNDGLDVDANSAKNPIFYKNSLLWADFDDTWKMSDPSGPFKGYPILKWQTE